MKRFVKRLLDNLCLNYLKDDYLIQKKDHSKDLLCDNKILDSYKVITDTGDVIFESKSPSSLIKENSYTIKALLKELDADDKIYKDYIKPILLHFAKLLSIAPASLCGHDSVSGGLFRHSLLVSYYLIHNLNIHESKCNSDDPYELCMSKSDIKDKLCLLLLGLLHDSAKLLTDYKIKTLGLKYTFSLSLYQSLDNFINEHQASHLRFFFKKQRSNLHESYFATMLKRFYFYNPKILKFLLNHDKKSVFYNLLNLKKDSALYRLLKAADGQAVTQTLERFEGFSSINTMLLQALSTNIIDLDTKGFYKVHFGLIVEAGSPAYQKIIALFDSYYERMELNKYFNEEEFFKRFLEKLSFVRTKENVFHEDHVSYFDNERYVFTDRFLLELLSDCKSYIPARRNFFQEHSLNKLYKQVALRTPYLWYELTKHGVTHLVQGFAIPFFNYQNDIYIIKRNVHVSIVKKLFKKLDLYSTTRTVTYLRTRGESSVDDLLKYAFPYDLIDESSVRFNDYRIEREKELKSGCNRRYKYRQQLKKMQLSKPADLS